MTVDLASPIFFVEFEDYDGTPSYAQVRLCTKRHGSCGVYHFNNSYTYIRNGAHIDRQMDNIIRIHYVETFDKLRTIDPYHWLLPENRS